MHEFSSHRGGPAARSSGVERVREARPHRRVGRHILAAAVVLSLGVVPEHRCIAADWVVSLTYSGSSSGSGDNYPPYPTLNWGPNGENMNRTVNGIPNCHVTSSGTVSATITWTGSGSPPSKVTVVQRACASWSVPAYPAGPPPPPPNAEWQRSGNASNGLKSPAVHTYAQWPPNSGTYVIGGATSAGVNCYDITLEPGQTTIQVPPPSRCRPLPRTTRCLRADAPRSVCPTR